MIKDLYKGNKELKESVQSITETNNKQNWENFQLQTENRDLRDRIEILENVIGAQTYDLNQEAWKDLLTVEKDSEAGQSTTASQITNKPVAPSLLGSNSNNAAIQQMMSELIEFRKGTSENASKIEKLE